MVCGEKFALLALHRALSFGAFRLAMQILTRAFDRVFLLVKQMLDLEQQLDFLAAIHAMAGPGFLVPDAWKFRLPIPHTLRFHPAQLAHITDPKVELIGYLRGLRAQMNV